MVVSLRFFLRLHSILFGMQNQEGILHDIFDFSGQVILQEFSKLRIAFDDDTLFQRQLIRQGQHFRLIGEHPQGLFAAIFPQRDLSVLNPQKKRQRQCDDLFPVFHDSASFRG